MSQWFGKHISRIVLAVNSIYLNITILYTLTNVVVSNIDMFNSTFLNGIGAYEYSSIVIGANGNFAEWHPKLLKQMFQPHYLTATVR